MLCGTAIVPLFASPSSLTAEDAASVRGMRRIHSGGCTHRLQNVLRARQPFRFSRSPAFAIDRVRSRFRSQNTPHSFQRLLTHARKRCCFRRLRYIFCTAYTRSFKMFCGTAIVPLFASAFAIVIDCVGCRFCAWNALHSFQRLFTLAYKRCCFRRVRHIFSYSCTQSFKIFCEHGKYFTFCASPRH